MTDHSILFDYHADRPRFSVLLWRAVQVVIEVDGPSAFSINERLPLGSTVARKCMLENSGYLVRSIPYYQWAALQGASQQKAYLMQLLRTVEQHSQPTATF